MIKLFLALFLFATFILPTTALAQAPLPLGPCSAKIGNQFDRLCASSTASNFGNAISRGIVALLVLTAVIALFFLIWGGFKWIASGGDKAKVEAARNTIIAAVVGLILAFLSYFILSVVLGLFGIKLTDLSVPVLTK